MPPAQAVATLYSLTHIASDTARRETLHNNIAYFRDSFQKRFGQTLNTSEKGDASIEMGVDQDSDQTWNTYLSFKFILGLVIMISCLTLHVYFV